MDSDACNIVCATASVSCCSKGSAWNMMKRQVWKWTSIDHLSYLAANSSLPHCSIATVCQG